MAPKPEIIKTTIRVPKPLWQSVQHLAIDDGVSAESIVAKALVEYLKKGGK